MYTSLIPVEKQKFITLTVTDACNLECVYCYEHCKKDLGMPFDVADRIITQEINADDGYEQINFHLFGGEPFLNFPLIKHIVEFIQSKKTDKRFRIDVTTNGTLIHGDIKKWLQENKDNIICDLSLDGTPSMHNLNRCNSFDLIDTQFFVETYPEQPIKMTISSETINSLSEGVIFCHSLGFRVFCNLAYGVDWSDRRYDEILSRELKILIDFYLKNPNIPPCSMLSDKISQIAANQNRNTLHSWCAAGTQTKAFDTNGKMYPCQYFMPLTKGDDAIESADIKFEKEVDVRLLDKECQMCKVRTACPTCFGYNYSSTGNMYSRDKNICRLTKIILKARSYFMAKQWEQGMLHLSENEEQALLRSILIIQET